MKNIFKSLMTLLAAAGILASCQEYQSAFGTDIKVTPSDAITFAAESPEAVTVAIECDGEWLSTSPEWITVEPERGNGSCNVTITAEANTVDGKIDEPRDGSVAFACLNNEVKVAVNQEGVEKPLNLPYANDFLTSLEKFKIVDKNLDPALKYVWVQDGTYGLKASGYSGANKAAESWVISPSFDLSKEETALLSFECAVNYAEPAKSIALLVSKDGETWDTISGVTLGTGSGWAYVETGDIDLSSYCGNDAVKFAFKYTSTADYAATVEIKNLVFTNVAAPAIKCKTPAVEILASATEAEFDLTAKNLEKSWKVAAKETYSWVKSITPNEGTESAKVKVVVDANTSEEPRTANFIYSCEGLESVELTLTQLGKVNNLPKTIAALNETATDTEAAFEAEFNDVIVTYVNGNAVFMEDATAGVELFLSGNTCKAGQKITGPVTGKIKLYNGFAELTAIDLSKATVTENNTIPCTTLTAAAFAANYKKYFNMRVKMEGVEVTTGINGKATGAVKQGDTSIAIRGGVNGVVLKTGDKGDLISYPQQYNNALQTYVYETSWFTVTESGSGDDGGGSGEGGEGGEGGGSVTGSAFVKVTSDADITAGKYLIVFGTGAHATISSKDLVKTADVTITDNKIAYDSKLDAATVEFIAGNGGFSVKLPSGKYLSCNANSNQSAEVTNAFVFTKISVANGISGMDTGGNQRYLYKNDTYYRFYKANTDFSVPQLYKLK